MSKYPLPATLIATPPGILDAAKPVKVIDVSIDPLLSKS
jgi:hypothetical protein